MKKKLYVIILAALISAPSFARDLSNAVFLNVGEAVVAAIYSGFGLGIGYERALSDNFSVLANGNYFSINFDNSNYTGVNAGFSMRYYLFGNAPKNLFVDIGGSYAFTYIERGRQSAASNTFELEVLAGWKFVFGKEAGLFLEPGYGYSFNFGEIKGPPGVKTDNLPNDHKLWLGVGFAF
ncbi:MAG: hypothetical protein LBH18_00280 [Spirochaetaceae bacterium]|jgi:hypothetical protein|nr:hypothetical protein [Spirochaetaceae bacterium]